MRLINKKYLIILTSILLVITTILVLKQTKPEELDEVKLLEASNNTSFAMYKEDGDIYTEVEGNTFPEGYVLNINKSKCIDNSGNEIKDVLSYEDNKVKLTSNKTSYCYLYFDESLGLEIKKKKPNKLSDTIKGDMYRFQGQQEDNVQNYICFGTSDKQTCLDHPDQYMYRIIGIEVKTGRVKVIKKEALDQPYQWYTDDVTDIKLPDSTFFKAINGTDFLDNPTYIPSGWKNKISDNNWLYGDMWEDAAGAKQEAAGLYDSETGKKATNWYLWSTEEDGGEPFEVVWSTNTAYPLGTILYFKLASGEWTDIKNDKISLMYLSDYSYSVGDEAKCNYYYGEEEYSKCKLGWMHISQNDTKAPSVNEWTMSRINWWPNRAAIHGFYVYEFGYTGGTFLTNNLSVRPVFYIDASQTLKDGTGKIDDPFIIF